MWLEISFDTDLQAAALGTVSDVIKNFKSMMTMTITAATLVGTVDIPHFGLSLPGHNTMEHQYA